MNMLTCGMLYDFPIFLPLQALHTNMIVCHKIAVMFIFWGVTVYSVLSDIFTVIICGINVFQYFILLIPPILVS